MKKKKRDRVMNDESGGKGMMASEIRGNQRRQRLWSLKQKNGDSSNSGGDDEKKEKNVASAAADRLPATRVKREMTARRPIATVCHRCCRRSTTVAHR